MRIQQPFDYVIYSRKCFILSVWRVLFGLKLAFFNSDKMNHLYLTFMFTILCSTLALTFNT